jgi:hypothetical protein
MFLMRADTLRGHVGGGWTLEIESFLGPVKCHRPIGREGGGGIRRRPKARSPLEGRGGKEGRGREEGGLNGRKLKRGWKQPEGIQCCQLAYSSAA